MFEDAEMTNCLDQLCFTAKLATPLADSFPLLREEMQAAFGQFTPRKLNEEFGYFFKPYRVWLAQPNSHGFIRITCTGDADTLGRLDAVFRNFFQQKSRCQWFGLKRAEIAHDFHFTDKTYREHEIILQRLAFRLIPTTGKNLFCRYIKGDSFQECTDGAINGKMTVYWQPFIRKVLEEEQKLKVAFTAVSLSKIYCKHYDGKWHIRLENTIQGTMLRKFMPAMPSSLLELPRLLLQRQFTDIWEFVDIRYEDFCRDAEKYFSGEDTTFSRLRASGRFQPACEQARIMRKIAASARSGTLRNRIRRYMCPLTPVEALQRKVPAHAPEWCKENIQVKISARRRLPATRTTPEWSAPSSMPSNSLKSTRLTRDFT